MTRRLVAIHQPNFLPWLGYFDKLRQADVFVVLDNVALQRTGGNYTNRVRLLAGGKPVWVGVPVVRGSEARARIDQARIAEHGDWRRKIRRTISQEYGRTPGYAALAPQLDALLELRCGLADFNMAGVRMLARALDIDDGGIVMASSLAVSGRATDLLVSIVEAVGGDAYLVGGGADGYQEDERFQQAGIAVRRQEFVHPVYPQGADTFTPGLSALDALMRLGVDDARRLLRGKKPWQPS